MTLIAAFRCDDGAVICADSMETCDDFYVRVDKIEPLDLGAYRVVIGGSGFEGGLIDGLTDVLADSFQTWAAGLNENALKNNVRYVLSEYYASQVKHHPASDDDKRMEFVICIKGKDSKDVFLWRTESTNLYPIKDFALIGYETPIYEYEAQRLYGSKGMPSLTRAVALGIHLLSLAKFTCRSVGGPTRVVVAKHNGIHSYHPEDVDVLEDRARKFSEALAELTLALPDVKTTESSFIEILGSFEEKVLALRGYYLRRLAQSVAQRIGTGETAARGELPMNTSIPIGDGLILHNSPYSIGISDGIIVNPQSDSDKSENQP